MHHFWRLEWALKSSIASCCEMMKFQVILSTSVKIPGNWFSQNKANSSRRFSGRLKSNKSSTRNWLKHGHVTRRSSEFMSEEPIITFIWSITTELLIRLLLPTTTRPWITSGNFVTWLTSIVATRWLRLAHYFFQAKIPQFCISGIQWRHGLVSQEFSRCRHHLRW